MKVCLCHPFSDKDAADYMNGKNGGCKVAEVYKACTGGENPNCCCCLETLKEIVTIHNRRADA